MASFTILLHCVINSDVETHQSATLGVSSTDSLLSIKQNIINRMNHPFESYMVQLGSGECLLNEDSSDEYLSSKNIGEFVDGSPSSVSSVHISNSLRHLTLLINHTKPQITTPSLRPVLHVDTNDPYYQVPNDDCDDSDTKNNNEDDDNNNSTNVEDDAVRESPIQTDNINETMDGDQNRDTDLLKMVYKLLIFFALIRPEPEVLNICTLILISLLLVLNHFKLLNFNIKVPSTNNTEEKEKLENSHPYTLLTDTKDIICTFVLSAFPGFTLIKSE